MTHSWLDAFTLTSTRRFSRLGGANFHEIPINAPIAQVHNNQRDGMHRQAINRGRAAYEPNSLGGGCPFQSGGVGFTSFAEPLDAKEHKVRGKGERFADHYTQATLFWNSQSDVERAHTIAAFRFELSRVQTPAVRERMISGLMNVDTELAEKIAHGLGLTAMPLAMPKVLTKAVKPEISKSGALSLFARPGDGGVRGRKVAILVSPNSQLAGLRALADGLAASGVVPRFLGTRLGRIVSAEGDTIEVDGTMESLPSVLFDGIVLTDGTHATAPADGRELEFLKDQYRHCKPILALGGSFALLEAAKIPAILPFGKHDPGLIISAKTGNTALEAFSTALAAHRHFARETDPPLV